MEGARFYTGLHGNVYRGWMLRIINFLSIRVYFLCYAAVV